MDNNTEEFDSESILYELLEYFIKKQEPELIRCKNDSIILPTTGTIKNALRYLNNRYSLPESLSQQISLTLPWKFAIGDSGKLLAILQENVIEIRRSKDEFSSIVAKASVPKDAFPQWRKLHWSPDGNILVLASSNGYLSFYNSSGNNLYNISPKTMSQNPEILEAGDAISSLTFHNPKNELNNWLYELLIVTYSGLLKSYSISILHGFKENYEFSFGKFYRKGVNAFAYDKKHDIYIVAGNMITQHSLSPASSTGLTSWRPINDYPHYKLSFGFEENNGSPTLSLWNLIPNFRKPEEPVIFRISISPSCNNLVCLHTDGLISLWSLPNLQLQKKWKLNEQPAYNSKNPLALSKQKKFPIGHSEFYPVDIGWWSEYAIIIARYSGAISVCSINDLKNLLGTSPEFLYGQPQICELNSGNGFLCLDCELIVTTKKHNNEITHDGQISEASDSEKEEDELDTLTFMNYATNLLRIALYSITDIETFQPKRKKSKIIQRTYRILGMKSTAPEELYSRKIDIEEYDEALILANAYKLDTDLVYQTQWRKSTFSLKAIQEHLSKVRKRSWILNECIMRVPDTLEAARELLNFGLKGANLQTLLAIGDGDDGKIVIEDTDDDDIIQSDDVSANLKRVQKINETLKEIDLTALSNSQKDLLIYRKKLLNHLDKLKTYEIIIDESKEYKRELYEKFRQLTVLENAVNFAKNRNCRAVEIMFTYHGKKLMPHWLPIISCFPETLNPNDYEKLLPECDESGQLFLLYQRELRPKDWLERNEIQVIFDNNNDDDGSHNLYESDSNLLAYKNSELTIELLHKWYKWRAYEIEQLSGIVENALELIKIGKSHNIIGLDDFLLELETLDDLVYKVPLENMSLAQLEKLTDVEKIKLLMSTAVEKTFVVNIKNYVLPYIYRKQEYLGGEIDKNLLKDYLIILSENDLTLTLKFFISVQQDIDILNMVNDIIALALNCIYACTNVNMYQTAKNIFDTLPKLQSSRHEIEMLNPMEELERELACLKILNKHNVNTTISFIHKNKFNDSEIKLLLKQMANGLNEMTPPSNQEQWAELLNDMLELQEFIFTCINIEVCFEICVQARLASGVKLTIQNCTLLIETKRSEQSLLKVSYDKAIELILQASKEYFNNSRSFNDSNMELSKACLNLIEDENELIQMEYELIYSLQILDEFNINILPMQVRMNQDRLKLIENCLNNRSDAYKRQQRLLTLANYLHIEGNNIRNREGKVLELVAKKAFDAEDYNDCSSICQTLIANNYFVAWRIIQQLGCCDNYDNLIFKQRCLSFAMTYGPSEILEKTLDHMNLLEIQILNKNLENWMATREVEDLTNDDESDDEFTDAMTTPQIEIKEFVPKILETSSGLVKSSAQIVKNSTIGILKSVSNQNFWRKTLNFNARNIQESSKDIEENIVQNVSHDNVQSFPFFYESLHSNCDINISRVDTKYDKYSLSNINNTNLKICQILLRVTLLTETSCYGLEISDINHFLIQSAIHIMPDDWLLGVAYLLTLNTNSTSLFSSSIDTVFSDLPKTDLFIQTAMYIYSLELYRQINPNSTDYFLYDPMDLIQMMVAKEKIMNDKTDHDEIKNPLIYWYEQLSTNNIPKVELTLDDNEIKVNIELNTENPKNKDKDDEDETQDIPNERDDIKIKNLYENDAFKITPGNNVDDASGWDDNWSDFSEHDDDVKNENLQSSIDPLNPNVKLKVDEDCASSEMSLIIKTDGNEINNDKSNNLCNKNNELTVSNNSNEFERYKIYEDFISQMKSKDDYIKLKNALKSWPAFIESKFTTLEKHPILQMLSAAKLYLIDKVDLKYQMTVLQEYKELLKYQTISPDVFGVFIKNMEENPSNWTLEDRIFLRLITDNPMLHNETIDIMKNDKTNNDYPLIILEEIFFKDLTALFPPHHRIYNKIVEVIFLNYNLPEIESHIRILIDKLIEQKHIPYALALWNQLAAIPSALSTFESCFQLYVKK